jgi:predicted phage-related endonuclease
MLTDEQKFSRLDGIGASEISAILGLDEGYWDEKAKKKTRPRDASDILALKTGQAQEFEGNTPTDWGNRLEPVIAEWYTDTYGGVATKSAAIWSQKIPFAFCTPDRLIDRGHLKHGLEIKNKAYSQKTKWKEGPPDAIVAQVKWSMMVTEWDRWDVAVLFNGNDPRAYTLHRDREWEENTVTEATKFWEKVQKVNRQLWG